MFATILNTKNVWNKFQNIFVLSHNKKMSEVSLTDLNRQNVYLFQHGTNVNSVILTNIIINQV